MTKRSVGVTWFVAALLLIGSIVGSGVPFENGDAAFSWEEETLVLSISFAAEPPVESAMLVVTVKADRFADGVYAWQLHYGPTHSSIVAIPNDFLTVQLFALEDLGVTAAWLDESTCQVRIPRHGVISTLVAEGDSVEIHALWLQQAPIVVLSVSSQGEVADEQEDLTATAGGGGWVEPTPGEVSIERQDQPAEVVIDSQGPVETEQPGGGAEADGPTSSRFPSRDTFTFGEIIRHSFVVIGDDGTSLLWVPLSISVMRDLGNEMLEFVQFQYIVCDDISGLYTYEIDTATVGLGDYILMIGSPSAGYDCNMPIRITPAETENES